MKSYNGKKYYLPGEVNELLGLGTTMHQLMKALPPPTHAFPGIVRKYYSEEDLASLKETYEAYVAEVNDSFTIAEAAKEFGVSHKTVRNWIRRTNFPKPTHEIGSCCSLTYTSAELAELKKLVENQHPPKGWLSTVEVANQLGQTAGTIGLKRMRLKIGQRYGFSWYFSPADVQVIKSHVSTSDKSVLNEIRDLLVQVVKLLDHTDPYDP